jgi:hypothetical protein
MLVKHFGLEPRAIAGPALPLGRLYLQRRDRRLAFFDGTRNGVFRPACAQRHRQERKQHGLEQVAD